SLMIGILSFMLEDTPTVGSVETSFAQKRQLAASSHAFNIKDRAFGGATSAAAARACAPLTLPRRRRMLPGDRRGYQEWKNCPRRCEQGYHKARAQLRAKNCAARGRGVF